VLAGVAQFGLAAACLADESLLRYRGETISADDLGEKMRGMLHRQQVRHFEEHALLVDEMLFELHLERESARTGEGRAAVAARLLDAPQPTVEEVERFYADNRLRISEPLDAVRVRIFQHLSAQRLAERKAALVARLKSEGGFVLVRKPPVDPPVALDVEGFPVRGRVEAPITVVEFGDYQCPRCARAVEILKDILQRHPHEVRLVYLDLPINRSGISRQVARGAACAGEQAAFWDYHDLAFARQATLDAGSAVDLAEALGLDLQAFERCLTSPAAGALVRRGESQARRLGIRGTPAVYVNGRPLVTHDLSGALQARIDELLGR
jgi:protein-disulfide isomerase